VPGTDELFGSEVSFQPQVWRLSVNEPKLGVEFIQREDKDH
jgi:hypothetical protein